MALQYTHDWIKSREIKLEKRREKDKNKNKRNNNENKNIVKSDGKSIKITDETKPRNLAHNLESLVILFVA